LAKSLGGRVELVIWAAAVDPADVPIVRSASVASNPASNRPVITPIDHALPADPPPPKTKARSVARGALRDDKVGDALMRGGQMEPMLADVVQANTHIDALVGFVVVQLYRLEGGPRTILRRQVRTLLVQRKAEYTVLASQHMHFRHKQFSRLKNDQGKPVAKAYASRGAAVGGDPLGSDAP
jgi:hypothetical protein